MWVKRFQVFPFIFHFGIAIPFDWTFSPIIWWSRKIMHSSHWNYHVEQQRIYNVFRSYLISLIGVLSFPYLYSLWTKEKKLTNKKKNCFIFTGTRTQRSNKLPPLAVLQATLAVLRRWVWVLNTATGFLMLSSTSYIMLPLSLICNPMRCIPSIDHHDFNALIRKSVYRDSEVCTRSMQRVNSSWWHWVAMVGSGWGNTRYIGEFASQLTRSRKT